MESVIPKKVDWLKDSITGFFPDRNMVLTASGEHIGYDFLVVAPGMQANWDKVKGLKESLGKDGVCSNYSEVVSLSVWCLFFWYNKIFSM